MNPCINNLQYNHPLDGCHQNNCYQEEDCHPCRNSHYDIEYHLSNYSHCENDSNKINDSHCENNCHLNSNSHCENESHPSKSDLCYKHHEHFVARCDMDNEILSPNVKVCDESDENPNAINIANEHGDENINSSRVIFELGGDTILRLHSNKSVTFEPNYDKQFNSDAYKMYNQEKTSNTICLEHLGSDSSNGSASSLKPVKFELGGEILLLDEIKCEARRESSIEIKGIMRQKHNYSTESEAQQNEDTENEPEDTENEPVKPKLRSRVRTLTFSEETADPNTKIFSEVYTNNGPMTAPVKSSGKEARRTFSFGGHTMTRKSTRQITVSGDSIRSMDVSTSMNRILTRALSRNLTSHTCSSDGSNSTILIEEWKPIFDKFDLEADGKPDGKIPMDRFRAILDEDPIWSTSVPQHLKDKIIREVDLNNDGVIDYEEFLILVRGKNLGLESKKRRAFRKLLKETVDFIVPYKYTYSNQYSCNPPPLFMLLFSFLQIFIFTYNSYVQIRSVGLYGPVPFCSNLIYNPNLRNQIWRYLTYSLIHSGLFHASFNILVQLILGIPLEMVHGGLRVSAVYLSGVLAGSLWTSVLKPGVYLSGASGGVYALIMGHLGTVIMNHREMSYPWCRVGIATLVGLTDVGVYAYETAMGKPAKPVSYPAHIAGAAAGLLVGIVCLRNLKWEAHQRYLWVACVLVYAGLISVAIGWNITNPGHYKGFNITIPCEENLI